MNETIFVVEESPNGGYTAKAVGTSTFSENDTTLELQENIKGTFECHFGN
jgi:hypothetical protein